MRFNNYTPTNVYYVEGKDGQLWSISNPSPDASVPNFTAQHPDGTILCSCFETKLMRDIAAHGARV